MIDKEVLREHFENNVYGVWRQGEQVSYERLGPDERDASEKKNPFEVVGGELVKLCVSCNGRNSEFIVHVYVPEETKDRYPNGNPFIICMHPLLSAELALSKGYALIVMENGNTPTVMGSHGNSFETIFLSVIAIPLMLRKTKTYLQYSLLIKMEKINFA